MYALFLNNRKERNIRKRNQSFGYGNRIRFIFCLKTSFEMSEGRLNVSFFSERQIISYNKGIALVNLLTLLDLSLLLPTTLSNGGVQ